MLNFLVSALNSVAMIVGLWDEKIRVRSSGRLKGPLCTTSTQDYSEAMIFFLYSYVSPLVVDFKALLS